MVDTPSAVNQMPTTGQAARRSEVNELLNECIGRLDDQSNCAHNNVISLSS